MKETFGTGVLGGEKAQEAILQAVQDTIDKFEEGLVFLIPEDLMHPEGAAVAGEEPAAGGELRVLSGLDPRTVGLKLKAAMRQEGRDSEAQRELLTGLYANSLARVEEEHNPTPEDLVDLAVFLLHDLDISRAWVVGGVVRLLPCLRGILEREGERGRNPGWYQSLTSLGVLASMLEKQGEHTDVAVLRVTRQRAIVYYHQVLQAACGGQGVLNDLRFLEQIANNLAAEVVQWLQGRKDLDDELREEVLERVGRDLYAVAIHCSLKMQAESKAGANVQWLPDTLFYGLLPLESSVKRGDGENQLEVVRPDPQIVARWFDAVTMVPDILGKSDDTAAFAYLKALGGIARLSSLDESRRKRGAASLFNAGVSLLRARKGDRTRGRRPEWRLERALLNASGLLWALKVNPDLESALGEGDGLDCAVNLYGALSDWPADTEREELMTGGMRELGATLLKLVEARGMGGADAYRISVSLKQLGITSAMAPPIPSSEKLLPLVRQQVGTLMVSLLRVGQYSLPDLPGDPAEAAGWVSREARVDWFARLVEALFAEMLRSDEDGKALLQKVFIDTYTGDRDTVTVLQEKYCQKYRDPGPLVGGEVLEPQEWKEWLAQSQAEGCAREGPVLGAAFRQVFRPQE